MSARKEALKPIPGRCPTPGELGKAGWAILHSAAAVFPHNPSDTQQTAFSAFLHGWSHSYACSHCAYHMRRYLEENPPVLTGKFAVNRYLCEFHNAVNERLGKDTYNCDPMNVLRRWQTQEQRVESRGTTGFLRHWKVHLQQDGGGLVVALSAQNRPEQIELQVGEQGQLARMWTPFCANLRHAWCIARIMRRVREHNSVGA
uniref:Sulfhydryl oxidase n=1 Tax=Trypanosoma vivax (strain Y486) TaxID=1055687 RepID=G0U298_TRYVY|nr:conserved hypothetical protein [Trypanosoma vivax Y486]